VRGSADGVGAGRDGRAKQADNVGRSKDIFIINDPLFHKGLRPLVTVSTAVITVLHSAEVVHFHYES
jgi:hypothetical protein